MASTTAQDQRAHGQTRRNIVISDPVAFLYLEEDPTVNVVSRHEVLAGYDIFLVEQWAVSRTDPTFIITTFTGDEKSKVHVGVLSIPAEESLWSMNLKLYFEGFVKYASKKQETTLGTIMVTNLSGFPSSLTVIAIPFGDVRANREAFFVNEDLKRLGCSGRVGLTLGPPTAATTAKFYQLYRASDRIPLNGAVLELVKLCQTALVIFGELMLDYVDGLLCDVTEEAIANWWVEFGAEYYNIEPHDGVLGPTTVAALLGTLIGARNRLHAYGAPVGKDVFDVETTKRAITHFQKSHRMSRTGRLDRQTLARIHRSTAKAASGDGWFVPRAVKSTMAELGGKGGELVMDMVGAGSKSRIAEVETVDIEQFIQNVQGERAKWLWRGKPRKETFSQSTTTSSNSNAFLPPDSFKDPSGLRRVTTTDSVMEGLSEKERAKKNRNPLDRSSTSKQLDPGRKLGRIKDAVGLSSATKSIKEAHEQPDADHANHATSAKTADGLSGSSPSSLNRAASSVSPPLHAQTPLNETSAHKATSILSDWSEDDFKLSHASEQKSQVKPVPERSSPLQAIPSNESESPSVAGSWYMGVNLSQLFHDTAMNNESFGSGFRRTRSFDMGQMLQPRPSLYKWPRHLSFSLAEDSVLAWSNLDSEDDGSFDRENATAYEVAKALLRREHINHVEYEVLDWVASEVHQVENLNATLGDDEQRLATAREDKTEEYHHLATGATEVMDSERGQLDESVKETEVQGAKLEYEINVLRGKVEDVEDGVDEFERQVKQVEERVYQLERSVEPKQDWWWSRMLKSTTKTEK